MARIVPPGSIVDMGFSDPMDKLNQTLDTFSKLQTLLSNTQVLKAKKDTSSMNTLSTLSGLIGGADDKGDLTYAQNVFDSINTNDITNPNTELIYGMVGRELESKSLTFDNIVNSGNDIASLMTSKFSVFDPDTENPMADKTLEEMNANEIISYFNKVSKIDGAYGGITKKINQINAFQLELGSIFGMTKDGKLTKKPNIKFKDANDNEINPTEYLMMIDRYKARLNMFVEAGFRDGTLNEQEAMAIVGGDWGAFSALKERKNQEFKFLAQQGTTTLRGIDTKISSLAKKDDVEFGLQILQDFKDSPKMTEAYHEYSTGIDITDGFEITDDSEQTAINAAAHASRKTKAENLAWYEAYRQQHADAFDRHRTAAQSWGFGWFGMPEEEVNLFDNDGGPPTVPVDYSGESVGDSTPLSSTETEENEIIATKSDGSKEINNELNNASNIEKEEEEKSKQEGTSFSKYYVPKALTGLSAAGAAYYYSDKITDAAKTLRATYKLPTKVIETFLENKNNIVSIADSKLDDFDKKIDIEKKKLEAVKSRKKPDIKAKKASTEYIKSIKTAENRIKKLELEKSKYKSNFINKYARDVKANPRDIRKLFDEGPKNKWSNLFKTKINLSKKFDTIKRGGRWVGGKYLPFRAGQEIADYFGIRPEWDEYGITGAIIPGVSAIGAHKILKKFAEKKGPGLSKSWNKTQVAQAIKQNTNKIKKKTIKAVKKRLGKAAAKRVGAAFAGGVATGGATPASWAVYLANAGLLTYDIVSIGLMLFNDGDITEEEHKAITEGAMKQAEYKTSKDYMMEPTESLKFNK